MSRKAAREHIFKIVYEIPFQSDEITLILDRYLRDFVEEPLEEEDMDFIKCEVTGTLANLKEIDGVIGGALNGWKVSRLSKVDLAILRLAAYELCFAEDMPVQVTVNEAVQLAKKYSQEQAPAFINGILGTVAKAAGKAPVSAEEAGTTEDER